MATVTWVTREQWKGNNMAEIQYMDYATAKEIVSNSEAYDIDDVLVAIMFIMSYYYDDITIEAIKDATNALELVAERINCHDPYQDNRYPERSCDFCKRLYCGPSLYCSLKCALDDA